METRRVLMRSLAVVVVIASVFWTTTAGDPQRLDMNCCKKVSSSVVSDPIIGIRLQRESLPCVKAVIFKTERGEFCSDPKQRWVKEKVKQFFRSQKTTPSPPPASSTTDQTHERGSTQATDSSSAANNENTSLSS